MSGPTPDESLRVFLREHLSGFEQLHALLCLAGGGERAWSAQDVALAIGLPLDLTESALQELVHTGGLVASSSRGRSAAYTFAPAGAGARELVSELARVYAEQPLAIIRMMNENALARVRSTAAHRLAEAFRLDREKK
ncbi:MAG: hypothetical protein EOO73_11340 [Myxococcales bacterium]|nr:MAG: hypothetical protein EOO73_11340 [Myxococcales bacterium]